MFEIDLRRGASGAPFQAGAPSEWQQALRDLLPGVALVVLLVLALTFASSTQRSALEEQQSRVSVLESEIAQRREELNRIAGRSRVLYGVDVAEVYWSDVLRLLAERMPDKVWITAVRTVAPPAAEGGKKPAGPPTLAIEGGVLSSSHEGNLDLIGQFLRELEADPRYEESFDPASLDSVSRSTYDPLALVFRIRLPFLTR